MSVNIEDYMVDVKGQKVIQYPGLLALAHEKGLKSMVSEIVEFSYGEYAVCKATVEFEDGSVFTSYGDAGVGNVSKGIAPHMLRMSETRAYGRALRNALNIGETTAEEMGDSQYSGKGNSSYGGGTKKRYGNNKSAPTDAEKGTGSREGKITQKQLGVIRELANEVYADSEEGKTGYEYFASTYPNAVSSIKEDTADTLIGKLEARLEEMSSVVG